MTDRAYFLNVIRRLSCNFSKRKRFTTLDVSLFSHKQLRSLSTFPLFQNKVKRERFFDSYAFLNITPDNRFFSKKVSGDAKSVIDFYEFSEIQDKNKENFNKLVSLYEQKFKSRKGVVDFILAALKSMKEFGVHEDLEMYKKLINLMPKGKYVPSNRLQVELMYFPREQNCILEVLAQMEYYGVEPDPETGKLLTGIFGEIGIPTRKYYRMMYWMPKFKHRSPWPLPRPVPKDAFIAAKLAIERITSVDLQTEITVFRTEDVEESIDKTWIISGQSPTQKRLLKKHDPEKPVIVEGGDHVWIRKERVNYFVLKSENVPYVDVPPESENDIDDLDIRFLNPNYKEKEKPSVHEQEDGFIYAVCATGTSTKDSLLSWIRLLQKNGNPVIGDLAVLFRFRKPPDEVVPYSDAVVTRDKAKTSS